ncbi:SEFIR domain-containing protein [Actinokineospora cianjurensis]|uniref:SEFIR domain-containing protein n=1 Tax=Actinokineospora cianjurensis TaxID=585224 RepID=A0A421BBL0_9PSEU|nr:SEFIR domain-containing protein [Actinokineospora cianjurensis]RLK61754.1 SEFIR domain-containing protein [Actinokineospora cianjurensis]
MPRAFVSYTHDSEEHKDLVLVLANALVDNSIDVCLDRWHLERQDWYTWAVREMNAADFVVVVASEVYRGVADGYATAAANLGMQCEAAILRDRLQGNRPLWTKKILPVLLPGHGVEEIPIVFQPYGANYYKITDFTTAGMEELLRVMLDKPAYVPPSPGQEPHLPRRTVVAPQRPPAHNGKPGVVNSITGAVVHGNIIQSGGSVTQG